MGSGLLSPEHLLVLLVVVLLVFGPKRLPELGRAMGSGMRGFKDAISGEEEDEALPTQSGASPVPDQSGSSPPKV